MKKTSKVLRFWPEILLFGLCVALYVYNAVRFSLPLGYAGLYSLMVEQIGAAGFALPSQIPSYGPGSLPFAYPPLGLYLAAIWAQGLNLPLLAYERFAPAFFGLLGLMAFYVLSLRLLQDRTKAFVGVLLAACLGSLYVVHLHAAGIVRGIAFLFMLLGLILSWDVLQVEKFSWRKALLAGMFFGLTGLSHLSYAVFLGISLLAFALSTSHRTPIGYKLSSLCAIVGVGLMVSAPWWLTVLARYGTAVFSSASGTHGTLGLMGRASTDLIGFASFLSQQLFNFGREWTPEILSGLTVLGLGSALTRRKWLLPLWFLLCFLLIGERDRFLGLIACLLVADLVVDLVYIWRGQLPRPRWEAWLAWAPVLLVLAFCYRSALKQVVAERPILSQAVIDTGQWLQANTPPNAVFLFVGSSHDLGEWLPYLAQRTPSIGLWGAEWTGKYERQSWLIAQMSECAEQQDFDGCANRLIQDEELSQDYLLVPIELDQLCAEIEATAEWQLAFENNALAVFAHLP